MKTAWYGKQTKGAKHEFFLIQVEDIGRPALANYLVLDRDAGNPGQLTRVALMSLQTAKANDAFRISYDGNCEKLLKDCDLLPYLFLEQISFSSDAPLHLYELATLADIASKRYPLYHLTGSGCYLFAGVIWECMRRARPTATYREKRPQERGKYHWFRYIPNASDTQETHDAFLVKLSEVDSLIQIRKKVNLMTPFNLNDTLTLVLDLQCFECGWIGRRVSGERVASNCFTTFYALFKLTLFQSSENAVCPPSRPPMLPPPMHIPFQKLTRSVYGSLILSCRSVCVSNHFTHGIYILSKCHLQVACTVLNQLSDLLLFSSICYFSI